MSLRNWTPCDEPDMDGRHHCPYADDGDYVNCEWYCGAEEPQDDPEIWEDEDDYEYLPFDWEAVEDEDEEEDEDDEEDLEAMDYEDLLLLLLVTNG